MYYKGHVQLSFFLLEPTVNCHNKPRLQAILKINRDVTLSIYAVCNNKDHCFEKKMTVGCVDILGLTVGAVPYYKEGLGDNEGTPGVSLRTSYAKKKWVKNFEKIYLNSLT